MPSDSSTPATTAPPTNTMALIGFILSLSSILAGITAIPGVILGHLGLKQIDATGEGGRGLAVAAIAVGYSVIGLTALALVIVLFVVLIPFLIIGIAAANGGYS